MNKKILSLSTAAFKEILQENIIPFWINKTIDNDHGGYIGRIDGYGKPHVHADKGIIFNARMLWSFSAFYKNLRNPEYLEMAERAYRFINEHFVDRKYGGVFWMVDYTGKVKEDKKQLYAHAFAIYAFVEFYKVIGDKKILSQAIEIFNVIEKYSFDMKNNGYLEAFDREWRNLEDLRLSEKDANEAKTMNTHLHILEAYTSLYTVWKDSRLGKQLEKLIHLFLERFMHDSGHLHLFFDEKWTLKSDKFSYGHDIETGWLLYEAAKTYNNNGLLMKCRNAAIKLTDAALQGLDADGGLMNEGAIDAVEDTDKHWWPQAEALVGLFNAWELTKQEKYLFYTSKVWAFIQEKIIDHQNGEWHWIVNKEGRVNYNEDKAGPWKSCYHNGRAMLELMSRFSKYNL